MVTPHIKNDKSCLQCGMGERAGVIDQPNIILIMTYMVITHLHSYYDLCGHISGHL